jgi:hypothetical protein
MVAMGNDHLSRNEIRKDAVQDAVQAAAGTVGQVASIVTTAVRDVAGVLGGFATEVFEIRDSARRASADQTGGPRRHARATRRRFRLLV